MPFDAKDEVQKINQWLKESAIPVYVKLDGKALALQATLPCKPGKGEGKRQQKIYLGIKANPAGIKRIKSEAQQLGHLITMDKFSWEFYMPQEKINPAQKTTGQLVEEFRQWYEAGHKLKEVTWREGWARTFGRLPQNEPLTESAILAVVLTTDPHTRNREVFCQKLQKLADYAGLEVDLSPYKGGYTSSEIKPRRIPSEQEIIEWRNRIPNPSWQWFFGVVASFGLRPHEAFFCQFDPDDCYTLKIMEGKTGEREAMAVHPEWVEKWNLTEVLTPPVKGKTYRDYGQRANRQFDRYKIPFNAYDLRHAAAIHLSVIKRLPVSTAAAFLGHDPVTHQRVYHRWLSSSTNKQVWRELMMQQTDDENK